MDQNLCKLTRDTKQFKSEKSMIKFSCYVLMNPEPFLDSPGKLEVKLKTSQLLGKTAIFKAWVILPLQQRELIQGMVLNWINTALDIWTKDEIKPCKSKSICL